MTMKQLFALVFFALSIFSAHAQEEDDPRLLFRDLERARAIENRDSIAAACNELSSFYRMRDADSTLIFVREGLDNADRNKVEPYIDLLMTEAMVYNSTGDMEQQIEQLRYTLKEAQRLKASPIYIGNIRSSLGVGFRRLNQVDSALYYYNAALGDFADAGDEAKGEIPFLLTNISILYANTGRLDEAERFVLQAVAESSDFETELYASGTAGAILSLLHKFDKAEQVLRATIDKARRNGMTRFVLQSTAPLLTLYQRTDNRAGIDRLIEETRPWLEKLPEGSTEVLGYKESLAQIFTQQRRFKESNVLYCQILDCQDRNAHTPLKNIYQRMAQNYAGMNRADRAAEYYERAIEQADSVYSSDLMEQMSQFSVQFETQKKELEIARLKEEKLEQKNRVMKWGAGIGLLVFALVLWTVYEVFRRRQLKQRTELEVARSFIAGLEKERTRLAKDLHDGICNDLLGVGMMLGEAAGDPQDVVRHLDEIRADVRSIAHELTPPKFQFATLGELLEDMLAKMFSAEDITAKFITDASDEQFSRIPDQTSYQIYRIVQELSSNILRHATAHTVRLELRIEGTRLVFDMENDGCPFDPRKRAHGIGLSTIAERAKSISAVCTQSCADGKQCFHFEADITK